MIYSVIVIKTQHFTNDYIDFSDPDDANSHQSFDELNAHPHHPSSNVLLSASTDEHD